MAMKTAWRLSPTGSSGTARSCQEGLEGLPSGSPTALSSGAFSDTLGDAPCSQLTPSQTLQRGESQHVLPRCQAAASDGVPALLRQSTALPRGLHVCTRRLQPAWSATQVSGCGAASRRNRTVTPNVQGKMDFGNVGAVSPKPPPRQQGLKRPFQRSCTRKAVADSGR